MARTKQEAPGFWNAMMTLGFIVMVASWVGYAPYTIEVAGYEFYIAAVTWLLGLVMMAAGTAFAIVAVVASRRVPAAAEAKDAA